ncbi:tumor necrosis factor ligand superfamily member 13 isoform X1 [Mixophyes fleayi]|uniref:tumor necrosis factor ligand superfamily member 13 isoform X1 n=1 Tax=Mixophyes fleayi TaxID=3061075 RepID=UPI003F4DE79A
MSHLPASRVLPDLARSLWGGTGAWLGVILCLIALVQQSIHLGNLQRELSLLQKSKEDSRAEVRQLCETPAYPRQKRDLPGTRDHRHSENRSLLHLVPQSLFSNVAEDFTEISWKVSLQRGKSLQVQGTSVRVKHSGIYSIYSQVFYRDNTFTMGHIVLSRTDGDPGGSKVLLRCVQSMPRNESLAYNTCYTSGVFSLHKGSTITLIIPRMNASLDSSGQGTFLGFVRL